MGGREETRVTTEPLAVRRELAERSHTLVRVVTYIDALRDDLVGAIDEEQFGTALVVAHKLAGEVCGTASIPCGGALQWTREDVTNDPYVRAPAGIVESARTLVGLACTLRNGGSRRAEVLAAADELIADLERVLELPHPRPKTREPDGMFALMSLGRGVLEATDAWNLPDPLPIAWRSS